VGLVAISALIYSLSAWPETRSACWRNAIPC